MIRSISYPCELDEVRQEPIHNGRNVLWLAKWNEGLVVVKDFGRPKLAGLEYCMRKSKARRSYENALCILKRGVATPTPIAYREKRSLLTNRLISCSYICEYEQSKTLRDYYDTCTPAFMKSFAAFVALLHEKGIRHDDLNNTNVRVQECGGTFSFSIIDLNRMRIYPDGEMVPLDECFGNITRFSCLDRNFELFVKEYLSVRNLPSSLMSKAIDAKKRHDKTVDTKKALKRLFK